VSQPWDVPLFCLHSLPVDQCPRCHAKRADPDTSHLAAAQLGDLHSLLMRLLALMAQGPATAQEVADRAGLDMYPVSKRLSDLDRLGFIADIGERRASDESGRLQMVRAVTSKGMQELGQRDDEW
jgi:predicted transcriptional regulator